MAVDQARLQCWIDSTLEEIAVYQKAILALGEGAQSWTLNTGQTDQRVTEKDLGQMNRYLKSLYNQYSMFCRMKTGGGNIVRPGF